jgi:ABC-type Zn2+ transport system substrate-binding protein/surface adhesin
MRAIFPHGAKTGILDPLGIDYQSNTGLYRALLLDLAKGFLSCAQ